MQERRHRLTTAADFHRLADLAHARGLRVFELGSNRWFCTSHSNPFALHTVTAYSCDCQGFLAHGRCSHYAALLAHLGWLPALEPEDAPATAPCVNCSGGGVLYVRACERAGWPHPPCPECQGAGEVPIVVALPLAA